MDKLAARLDESGFRRDGSVCADAEFEVSERMSVGLVRVFDEKDRHGQLARNLRE